MNSRKPFGMMMVLALCLLATAPDVLGAQEPVPAEAPMDSVMELTLEGMVHLALSSSYRMRHLNLDIERTRLNLQASRAQMRSRVDLDFTLPTINHISESRWDSDLQRNVIQQENSRRVEAGISVRQPVILFGYPTNGYLSLNNRMYRLSQEEAASRDIRYYNRYFVSYTQPLFQANELKNDLEEAELELEGSELEFYGDVVQIIENTSEDYLDLFEIAYEQRILAAYVARLEGAVAVSDPRAGDPERSMDADQIRVELANAREDLTASENRFRLETSSLKTEFELPTETVITLMPVIELSRVPIDVEVATRHALELSPRMRQLEISHRESELDLDNRRGRGGFELDVELSYGREMQHEILGHIWREPENAYTVDVRGSLPIWDWGERDAEIQAQQIGVRQSSLRIEETTRDITTDVQNEVRNIGEYEDRAFNMQENLALSRDIADTSLERYEARSISALDLLQTLRREMDTARNFLDAYLGWRTALQRIQELTFYDWESDSLLLDRFGIAFEGMN